MDAKRYTAYVETDYMGNSDVTMSGAWTTYMTCIERHYKSDIFR